MADVRLTATNPADSSVVPVACNEKGELKLEEPILVEGPQGDKGDKGDKGDPGDPGDPFSGNFAGDVTFGSGLTWGQGKGVLSSDGSASLVSGDITLDLNGAAGAPPRIKVNGEMQTSWVRIFPTLNALLENYEPSNWSCIFSADFNNRATHVTYADGSAFFKGDVIIGSRNKTWMIVESNGLAHLVDQSPSLEKGISVDEYPQLRNIPGELTMVETQLQKVMERLKMVPESGWEVWDGSD